MCLNFQPDALPGSIVEFRTNFPQIQLSNKKARDSFESRALKSLQTKRSNGLPAVLAPAAAIATSTAVATVTTAATATAAEFTRPFLARARFIDC